MLIALAFAHFSSELLLKEFSANFDFFPRKSREIGRFFREFAPENPAKFCFSFREISEALYSVSIVVL